MGTPKKGRILRTIRYGKYAYSRYGTVLPYCRTGTSLGVLQLAAMKAARKMGAAAGDEAVRQAAGVVVVWAMQVGDMGEALAEVAGAAHVQAMGSGVAELTVMGVAQGVLQEGRGQ